MAIFTQVIPSRDFQCAICLENPNEDMDIVAHQGQGQLHPVHKKCLVVWAQKNTTCPLCRVEVDRSSLITFRERTFTELRHIVRDGVVSALSTMIFEGVRFSTMVFLGVRCSLGDVSNWRTAVAPVIVQGLAGGMILKAEDDLTTENRRERINMFPFLNLVSLASRVTLASLQVLLALNAKNESPFSEPFFLTLGGCSLISMARGLFFRHW